MSDQDFFFDEDETTAAEAAKPASKSASKATPGRSSAAKATPAAKTTPAAKAPAAKAAPASAGGSQVSLTVAALMTVVGLLLGVIIGFVLPGGGSSTTTGTTTTGAPAGMGGTGSAAPQLSEDQLQSGELPPGHPPVASSESSETTTSGQ